MSSSHAPGTATIGCTKDTASSLRPGASSARCLRWSLAGNNRRLNMIKTKLIFMVSFVFFSRLPGKTFHVFECRRRMFPSSLTTIPYPLPLPLLCKMKILIIIVVIVQELIILVATNLFFNYETDISYCHRVGIRRGNRFRTGETKRHRSHDGVSLRSF